MFDCDQGPHLTAVRLGTGRNGFRFQRALGRGPDNPRARTIGEPVPFQEERWDGLTWRSQTKQNGMVLIVKRVTWNIRPEKCKDGKAGILEEKIPIMAGTKEKRSTGAASSFFR